MFTINPNTNRVIRVGGGVWKKLMKENILDDNRGSITVYEGAEASAVREGLINANENRRLRRVGETKVISHLRRLKIEEVIEKAVSSAVNAVLALDSELDEAEFKKNVNALLVGGELTRPRFRLEPSQASLVVL